MSRYRQIGGYDDTIVEDGDDGFIGVDMRRKPNLLEGRACSYAENMRFANGEAESRKALTPLSWATPMATTWPLEFPIQFNIKTAAGLGPIFGATRFADPRGVEYLCLAVADGAYFATDHGVPVKIGLPEGERIEGQAFLLQAFNMLLVFRGEDADPLVWDSAQIAGDLSQFSEIEDPANTEKIRIPRAATAETASNRLFIPFDRDEVAVSDILEYTQYDRVTSQWKINKGESGSLLRIYKWSETTLLLFKTDKIYSALNVYGDLSAVKVDTVPSEHGLIAPNAIATVGSEVWYLSNGGVYSLLVTNSNKVQSVGEPMSGPMQPMMDRINWPYASKACATTWNNHYYLAVPIDNSRVNNCVLVYNQINKAWSGFDSSPIMDVAFWVKVASRGKERLVAVSSVGVPYLYEEGDDDELGPDYFPIESVLRTRGYAGSVISDRNQIKKWVRGTANVCTWAATVSIIAQVNGVNETESVRAPITKDRRKYVQFGMADYDTSNINDDHGAPGREDYSVVLDEGDELNLGSGIVLDRMQDFPEEFTMGRRGQYVQAEIRNTGGRIQIKGVSVEGYVTARSQKTEVV